MDAITLRELTLADLDELLDWRMEVLDCVFADDPTWNAPALRKTNRRYYENTLGSSHRAVVASVNGEDAGCGAVCFQDELPSPDNPSGKNAYLMNIYTRSAWRGKGVGAAVVKALIAFAREAEAEKIYLEATAMGTPLYTRLGFVPMDAMMKLPSKQTMRKKAKGNSERLKP